MMMPWWAIFSEIRLIHMPYIIGLVLIVFGVFLLAVLSSRDDLPSALGTCGVWAFLIGLISVVISCLGL
jgi:hypothetical protein